MNIIYNRYKKLIGEFIMKMLDASFLREFNSRKNVVFIILENY